MLSREDNYLTATTLDMEIIEEWLESWGSELREKEEDEEDIDRRWSFKALIPCKTN